MEYMFTFQNTHSAIYGEKILKEHDIPVYTMALPSSLGDACGICLRVEKQQLEKSYRLLSENQLKLGNVYGIDRSQSEVQYIPWNP